MKIPCVAVTALGESQTASSAGKHVFSMKKISTADYSKERHNLSIFDVAKKHWHSGYIRTILFLNFSNAFFDIFETQIMQKKTTVS